jgi:dihydroneopterin aldolase/2-amino-4-hydroxy-6-hydroxymethyldihydropteridine diphosphokinase
VYGSVLAVTDDLELPHPRAHERAFVLEPWAQVDPQAVLPGLGGGPVAALAATAPDREGIRWLALDWLSAPSAPAPDGEATYDGAEAPDS